MIYQNNEYFQIYIFRDYYFIFIDLLFNLKDQNPLLSESSLPIVTESSEYFIINENKHILWNILKVYH
jgi:hypothetical protein